MPHPVLGIGRLLRGDPGAGLGRNEGPLGRLHLDRPEVRTELLQDRFEHRGMGRNGDTQALRVDLLRGELLLQRFDRRHRTGGEREFRGVHRRQRQFVAEQREQVGFRQRHAQHGAGGHFLEEAAAEGDQTDRILEREDAGQVRRRVLAHRVPDHRLGDDPPGFEQLGHRVLRAEQRRERQRGLLKFERARLFVTGGREEQGAHFARGRRLEVLQALIDGRLVHRLVRVQLSAHARELCAASGEHECRCGTLRRGVGEDVLFVLCVEQAARLFSGPRGDDAPFLETVPTDRQRVRRVGQREFRVCVEMVCEIRRGRVERALCPRGNRQQLPSA